MRKQLSVIVFLVFLTGSLQVRGQLLKEATKIIGSKSGTGYTESEAAQAIKDALVKGTGESVTVVSKVNGYFGNPEIKIPFPPDAKIVETKLRSMGMGSKVDQAIKSINEAAEKAAKDAQSIFVSAITSMTVTDAINIVKGQDDAATQYLKGKTSKDLKAKFQPNIKASLDQVYATKYWKDIMTIYNKIPYVQKVNPNLDEYVTGKAIDGLFVMIAKEEKTIRKDPVAQTTDLLKKVFGSK